jgi:2-haloacid dehalogenase
MRPDAIAFDAFGTLFDLEALRGPLGDDVFEAFAARLVPWTWHATAAGAFKPFPEIAVAAAEAAGAADPGSIVEELVRLPAFPDVAPGLDALAGTPLAVLSNGTAEGLHELVSHAGLEDRFDHLLAADQVGRYKPAPELYALAPRAFGAPAGRVLLVSSNEWDVTGAAQSGLRTAWLGRGRTPAWVLGVEADLVVDSIAGLAGLAG